MIQPRAIGGAEILHHPEHAILPDDRVLGGNADVLQDHRVSFRPPKGGDFRQRHLATALVFQNEEGSEGHEILKGPVSAKDAEDELGTPMELSEG